MSGASHGLRLATFEGQLDTPTAVVETPVLERNLLRMRVAAATAGIAVRPHVKTHKCPAITTRQIELGAIGITCATLEEAEGMIAAGVEDVLVYYPMVGERSIRRLVDLSDHARVSTTVESTEAADQLAAAARRKGIVLPVLIDVDTGLRRTGIELGELEDLLRYVSAIPALEPLGIGTHEGFSYGVRDPDKRNQLLAERLGAFAEAGRRFGVGTISCGSTPSIAVALQTEGITEIRPGNYAFHDRTQVDLGVAELEDCALTILTTVVSAGDQGRATVDAGSKALSSDRGAHGGESITGHGVVPGRSGIEFPALSEEHGFVALPAGESVSIGDRLRMVPNHSCAAVANFGELVFVSGGRITSFERLVGRRGMETGR